MSIVLLNSRSELPQYDEELYDTDSSQQISVLDQEPYVALVQWDGAGESRHWLLVDKEEVETLIEKLREVLK